MSQTWLDKLYKDGQVCLTWQHFIPLTDNPSLFTIDKNIKGILDNEWPLCQWQQKPKWPWCDPYHRSKAESARLKYITCHMKKNKNEEDCGRMADWWQTDCWYTAFCDTLCASARARAQTSRLMLMILRMRETAVYSTQKQQTGYRRQKTKFIATVLQDSSSPLSKSLCRADHNHEQSTESDRCHSMTGVALGPVGSLGSVGV